MSRDKLDLDLSLINKFLRNEHKKEDFPMMRKVIEAFQNGELVDVDIPIDVELIALALMDPSRDLMADLEEIGLSMGDVMELAQNPQVPGLMNNDNTQASIEPETSESELEFETSDDAAPEPEPEPEPEAVTESDMKESESKEHKRDQKWKDDEIASGSDTDTDTDTDKVRQPPFVEPEPEPEPEGEVVVTTTNDGGLGVAFGMFGGLLGNVDKDMVNQVMSGEMDIEDSGVDPSVLSSLGIDMKDVSQFVNNNNNNSNGSGSGLGLLGLINGLTQANDEDEEDTNKQDPEAVPEPEDVSDSEHSREQPWEEANNVTTTPTPIQTETNDLQETTTDDKPLMNDDNSNKNESESESEHEREQPWEESNEVTPTPEVDPDPEAESQQIPDTNDIEKVSLIELQETMTDDKQLMNEDNSPSVTCDLCVIL